MVLAPPAPPVRAAGSRVTASTYGSDVTDSVNFLSNAPLFKGSQSAVQSIPNAAVTPLALDASTIDTYSGHSTVTNNTRYTCNATAPGWYLVIAEYASVANATGARIVRINKNGTYAAPAQCAVSTAGAGFDTNVQVIAVVQLAAGDYLEAAAYQTSGGALNTTPGDTGVTIYFIHE